MVLLTLSAGTETDRLKSGAAVVMLRRELFFFFPMLEKRWFECERCLWQIFDGEKRGLF